MITEVVEVVDTCWIDLRYSFLCGEGSRNKILEADLMEERVVLILPCTDT